jgi:hypothetical protein
MSAILRHRHPNRFTVLPNDAIRNPALSFRAVGVLAHLLSLPDGAKVDSATLASAHKEGRDAVRSAFSELAQHGYYRRDVIRLPDGTLRTEVVVSNTPMDPAEGNAAGPTGDGFSGVGPGPGNPASVEPAPVNPTSVGPTPVDQAPKEEVPITEELIPPQPPRRAGGHGALESEAATTGGRRSSRGAGTNPRAEAERAEAARLEAEAARRQAELEARTEARRAADLDAERAAERLEAEALAIAATLDDETLGAVVARAAAGLSGLLAGSTVAVTRAVVAWCRSAAATHPGPFAAAVAAGLAGDLAAVEGGAPLDLPAAPAGTAPLRTRIAAVLKAKGAV